MRMLIVAMSAACCLCSAALAQSQSKPLVTILRPTMPELPLDPKNAQAQDTSPQVCRPPQPQTDSRLPGPTVCRTQRQWDDLHARGLDVSADGKGVVATEKYRTFHARDCGTANGCN